MEEEERRLKDTVELDSDEGGLTPSKPSGGGGGALPAMVLPVTGKLAALVSEG